MEAYDQILCFIAPAAAVYCIYLWVMQSIFRTLPAFHMLLTREAREENCNNLQQYFRDSSGYILALAAGSMLFGCIDIYTVFTEGIVPGWVQYAVLVGYIAFLAVFSLKFREIVNRYWNSQT